MASAKEGTAKIAACLSVTHHRHGLSIPTEVRPYVGGAFAGFARLIFLPLVGKPIRITSVPIQVLADRQVVQF